MPPELSLVIPAYNEVGRVGAFLADVRDHLDAAYPGRYEVLVVDDGSRDGTADLVRAETDRWPELRLLGHNVNRGKGAAVRTGMLEARGTRLLFADADGATPIAEERRLAAALDGGAAVAVGSRVVPGIGVTRDRNWRRAVGGRVFAWAARAAVGVRVRDTQCGFKMFDGEVGRYLFAAGAETGYLFDLEVLALAAWWGYPVAEVAVNWSERAGSKVRLVRDTARMFGGLPRLRKQVARGAAAAAAPAPRFGKAA